MNFRSGAATPSPQEPKAPIAFWFDFISPFGYFASLRIDDLAAQYGRTTDWTSMLLGVSVMKVMGLPPITSLPLKGAYIQRDAARFARQHDVPFKRPSGKPPPNPLPAGRAFAWVKETTPDRASAFATIIYRRSVADNEDIGAAAVIADAVREAGIDTAGWDAAMQDGTAATLLKRNVERGLADGVFGSPFFIVDSEPFFGVEKLPVVEDWLRAGGW